MRYLQGENPVRPTNQQLIREENIKRLFNLLSAGGEISRAELGRLTGLSPTTVSSLVEALLSAGLVIETGPAPKAHSGRKAINLRVNPDGRQVAVFSLNRWGVRYTLFDLNFATLETAFVSHDADRYGGFDENSGDESPEAGEAYADLMEGILRAGGSRFDPDKAACVCVSHPGLYLEREKAFSLSALHVSFARGAMEALERRLDTPLFFGNSSMSLAYAEKKCLEAGGESAPDLIYLNVCEGVGAGILRDGEIYAGPDGTAGEIGHVSIDYKGLRCACGGRGCLERYVSTVAALDAIKRAASEKQCTELLDMARDSYDNITLELAGKAYDAGVSAVVEVVNDLADKLHAALYGAVCLTGIKRVVIGGGIERLGRGFLDRLIARSRQDARHFILRDIQIDYTRLGFKGDSLGIAQYFMDKAFKI